MSLGTLATSASTLPASSVNAIELDGLTKRFGEHVAVDRLTFTVPSGSVFGFLGPNGAGKTTSIGMMLGLVPSSDGTARIFGYDVKTQLPEVLARIGAMVERPAFYPYLSGRMNLRLFAQQVGISNDGRVEEIIRLVNMAERADAKFGGYSTGMKQRIGIGAALLADPQLVILDEPTSGLDPAGQREIRGLVKRLAESGHTVFLSSHILTEVQEVCTHLAIIDHGKLVTTGPIDEIISVGEQLQIDINDPESARDTLLASRMVESATVVDGRLIVDAPFDQAAEINRTLVQSGYAVSQLRHREGQLEERFLELTESHGSEANNG